MEFYRSDEDGDACIVCGKRPCIWVQNMDISNDHAEKMANTQDNCKLRKAVHRIYIYEMYEALGKGNRMRIPVCVRDNIRPIFSEIKTNIWGI